MQHLSQEATPDAPPRKHPPHGTHPSTEPFPRLEPGHAIVQEVFSSVQGEGLYAGDRHIFVRLAHCHLNCHYCDTPMTTPSGHCQVETEPGSNHWVDVPGLQNTDETLMLIAGLASRARHTAVSFTGGEPLLYPQYLQSIFPRVQQLGLKTYLETSGTQPAPLAKVLAYTDIIAMDVKLPSTTRMTPRWQQHADFVQTARQADHVELFVKCVINGSTTPDELNQLRHILPDRATPIYLQPETDIRRSAPDASAAPVLSPISGESLLALQALLAETFHCVRVLPQTHKFLNLS